MIRCKILHIFIPNAAYSALGISYNLCIQIKHSISSVRFPRALTAVAACVILKLRKDSGYYAPETGRFISPDDISYLGANGDLNAYNLYAYCDNNPVMRVDHVGQWNCGGALGMGGLTMLSGTFAYGAGALSSLVYIPDSMKNKIAQNFVNDIFSAPISWIIDLIGERI